MATTSELDQAPLHTSNSGTDDVTTAATPPSAETPRKTLVNGVNVSSWSYRLKLALALAFPVFLEVTLTTFPLSAVLILTIALIVLKDSRLHCGSIGSTPGCLGF
jgi:hypothetical protein